MHEIRRVFVARDDYVLVMMDYDQIEIKLAAHFSGQEYMLEAILAGKDLHALSAQKYFNSQPQDKDFKLMRTVAKTQNYAMLYGCRAYRLHVTLMQEAGIRVPLSTCEKYVDAYWTANDKLAKLTERLVEEIDKTGGVRNPYGRFVPIGHGLEYTASNGLIQSTAADIIKSKMLLMKKYLKESKALSRMLIMVHDELIFEIHKSERAIIPELKTRMEEQKLFKIPITCSVKWGRNWLDKKTYKDC